MAPRLPPTTGFCGVRRRESGRYAAEITCYGDRTWLGTFDTTELVARAYDAVASMYGRKPDKLNFPEDAKHAWFLAPLLPLHWDTWCARWLGTRVSRSIRMHLMTPAWPAKISAGQSDTIVSLSIIYRTFVRVFDFGQSNSCR